MLLLILRLLLLLAQRIGDRPDRASGCRTPGSGVVVDRGDCWADRGGIGDGSGRD